jgi:hypothetical protein
MGAGEGRGGEGRGREGRTSSLNYLRLIRNKLEKVF